MDSFRHIHFIGICGTAMGAVAAAVRERGITVTGSDENIYPPISTFLESQEIYPISGFRAENIPSHADLIVIGNAIRRGNPEVEAVLNRKLLYFSLPEMLKYTFLLKRHNLVVTGTHGKTTTTALLAWILENAQFQPGYLIGGVPNNLGRGACLRDSNYFVIEGDEYDTAFFDKRSKFIHYLPELLIINNIEFDHADIFRDLDEIKTSFRRLVNIVPSEGMILINGDDENCREVTSAAVSPVVEVGFSANASNQIRSLRFEREWAFFELFRQEFRLPLIGEFNVRNAAMAISAAHFYGVPFDVIQRALSSFQGVHRRQEIRGEVRKIKVIDDFGHHPTAIRQTLRGLRHKYGPSRIWAVFEPRSNTTRRSVFQHDLPKAFVDADGVLIAQVAAADQIPPAERLDPQQVVHEIVAQGKQAFYEPGANEIVQRLQTLAQEGDVIVVFSNGGFDNIHTKLLEGL
ncbi:MAG: UDP-N-acetylmuramate:L-alanyl-gamma-D-glutamyl-meso-diaminopimelate ligase [Verrucomicrobia bacterium]|nr:MAG: UDP-N-acetylmuramate:L-alanyl-gamma-D-glutamyl-meso-diaminopimelate ligase [Verrucomicrobiota bacterium]